MNRIMHSEHAAHAHENDASCHLPASFGKAFIIGAALNIGFIAAEVMYGLAAHSLALLADAGHNASDVLGLLLAWGAVWLTGRKPCERYTYGLRGASILAALFNAALLLAACGAIGWEAILRLGRPEPVSGTIVIMVAAVGIAVNGSTAWLFRSGRKSDLNIRAVYLHMAVDALVSLGVVLSGALMAFTGWLWLDALTSLTIAAVIFAAAWRLLTDSIKLALHAAPGHVDTAQVREYLASLPGVQEVHDLHIWAMSTRETALSAHLLMPGAPSPNDRFLKQTARALEEKFHIGHSTIQIETGDSERCTLADHAG